MSTDLGMYQIIEHMATIDRYSNIVDDSGIREMNNNDVVELFRAAFEFKRDRLSIVGDVSFDMIVVLHYIVKSRLDLDEVIDEATGRIPAHYLGAIAECVCYYEQHNNHSDRFRTKILADLFEYVSRNTDNLNVRDSMGNTPLNYLMGYRFWYLPAIISKQYIKLINKTDCNLMDNKFLHPLGKIMMMSNIDMFDDHAATYDVIMALIDRTDCNMVYGMNIPGYDTPYDGYYTDDMDLNIRRLPICEAVTMYLSNDNNYKASILNAITKKTNINQDIGTYNDIPIDIMTCIAAAVDGNSSGFIPDVYVCRMFIAARSYKYYGIVKLFHVIQPRYHAAIIRSLLDTYRMDELIGLVSKRINIGMSNIRYCLMYKSDIIAMIRKQALMKSHHEIIDECFTDDLDRMPIAGELYHG